MFDNFLNLLTCSSGDGPDDCAAISGLATAAQRTEEGTTLAVYHFVLTYSNWETGMICYSESLESLSEGRQNVVWRRV